jgi:UTP--glucose-1-phosphate uridylyltransferase
MITKAIIPVAGWGTRRLPITKAIEKCMLPIGNRPMVDFVVQDCIKAGITDIYFVTSEESTQIQAYYGDNGALNTYLIRNGKEDLLSVVAPPRSTRFHYVTQPDNGKYGTAIPVALVAPYIKPGESVAVIMGDAFFYDGNGGNEIARMIAETPENGNATLGFNVPRDQVGHYGIIDLDANRNFVSIVEKPTPERAPSTLASAAQHIMNHDLIMAIVNYVNTPISGEYFVTDPINQYVINGGSVRVVAAQSEFLDGGNLEGWLHANNVVVARA